MEWITWPSNVSGPLPCGNVGMLGTPLNLPMQRMTKSALCIWRKREKKSGVAGTVFFEREKPRVFVHTKQFEHILELVHHTYSCAGWLGLQSTKISVKVEQVCCIIVFKKVKPLNN